MRDLVALRRRLVALAIVLGVIAVSALVFLFTPYGRSKERLEDEFAQLRDQKTQKELESGPLANIDQKLVEAHRQIDAFYRDRLPAQYSDISAELAKQASANGVKLGGVKYDADKDAPAPGVRAVHITAAITGNYVNIVKFINALERDKMLLAPASVDLTESQAGVSLDLRLDTYLREGAGGTTGGM
jgi:Tfp pilus assembly protein PilO